jgi:hypothetical protein
MQLTMLSSIDKMQESFKLETGPKKLDTKSFLFFIFK